MGSICDERDTRRANAVLHEDPEYIDWLRNCEGATIASVDYGPGEAIGTIVANFSLQLPDGTTTTITGPTLREVTEDGICGFSLQFDYEQDKLRQLLTAAIANPGNGLDDDDRETLREELTVLPEYYGS